MGKDIPEHIRRYIDYTISTAISKAFVKMESKTDSLSDSDQYISAEQAARLLKIKLSTLYSKVESGELPYYRSGKRKLLFAKAELFEYISSHRYKSNQEISEEARKYIISKNNNHERKEKIQ